MYFYIIKYVYSFQRTHISVRHFVGVFIYASTINRPLRLLTNCKNVADGLPNAWRTDCDNIAKKLQQPNIQKTKTILLQCKNPLFAR